MEPTEEQARDPDLPMRMWRAKVFWTHSEPKGWPPAVRDLVGWVEESYWASDTTVTLKIEFLRVMRWGTHPLVMLVKQGLVRATWDGNYVRLVTT